MDRCFLPSGHLEGNLVEVHHFADASGQGYAAVAYLRFVSPDGDIHCPFVMGKSRLCPVKYVTIPRLELTAAVLLVKLNEVIKTALDIKVDETFFWTDLHSCTRIHRQRGHQV